MRLGGRLRELLVLHEGVDAPGVRERGEAEILETPVAPTQRELLGLRVELGTHRLQQTVVEPVIALEEQLEQAEQVLEVVTRDDGKQIELSVDAEATRRQLARLIAADETHLHPRA